MCCFSRAVEFVANTNIFARTSKGERQYLVYGMRLSSKEDLAMILPIPVPKESKEDSVRFINLEKYPDFFKDLNAGFPKPDPRELKSEPKDWDNKAPRLEVKEVGSFEASFVPTVKDFERLDERFRLPAEVWDKLPKYKDFGFAVFKLKKGAKNIHPMAFEFPRDDPKRLFLPTVHIHDGKVHPKAKFDHTLYCQQGEDEDLEIFSWAESTQLSQSFVKIDLVQGILNPDGHVYKKDLRGELDNKDTILGVA